MSCPDCDNNECTCDKKPTLDLSQIVSERMPGVYVWYDTDKRAIRMMRFIEGAWVIVHEQAIPDTPE